MQITDLNQFWERGWEVIPIQPGSKKPRAGLTDWPQFRHEDHTAEELGRLFEGHGVALLLGPSSSNVVDVDLDSSEARHWSRYILDAHTLKIGRPGNPNSHFLYVSEVLANQTSRSFHDPFIFATEGKRKPLLELRTRGHYQLIPPTEHPDVDAPYQWGDDRLVTPVEIDAEDLSYRVSVIAVLSMLTRYWHRWEGSRHDLWMHVCGGLLRSNPSFWSGEGQLESVSSLFTVASGYHDEAMLLGAARTTLHRFNRGQPFTGWGSMYEILKGNWSGVADACRDWLPAMVEVEEVEEEVEPVDPPSELVSGILDVRALLSAEVPEFEWLIEGFVVRGEITVLLGSKGVGKSLLTLAWAHRMMEAGERILYYDEENGIATMQERARDLGISEDDEGLFYWPYPNLFLMNNDKFAEFLGVLRDLDITVIVFDSMVDVLGTSRISILENMEVADFYRQRLQTLKQMGYTLLLQDHKPASGDKRAKGVGEKDDIVQVIWDIEATQAFSRNTDGVLRLEIQKDRRGYIGPSGFSRRINVDTTTVPGSVTFSAESLADVAARQAVALMNSATSQNPTGRK